MRKLLELLAILTCFIMTVAFSFLSPVLLIIYKILLVIVVGYFATGFIAKGYVARREKSITKKYGALLEQLSTDTPVLKEFAALPSRDARKAYMISSIGQYRSESLDFLKGDILTLEAAANKLCVDYSKIPRRLYPSSLLETESVNEYASRVKTFRPEAEKALQQELLAIVNANVKAARMREIEFEVRGKWAKLDFETREALALANEDTRRAVSERLLPDYLESEKATIYDALAQELRAPLDEAAAYAFKSLAFDKREEISLAAPAKQKELLSEYIPNFNPALISAYLIYARVFVNTPQAPIVQDSK